MYGVPKIAVILQISFINLFQFKFSIEVKNILSFITWEFSSVYWISKNGIEYANATKMSFEIIIRLESLLWCEV